MPNCCLQYVTPPPGCERVQYRSSIITLFVLYVIAFLEETAIIAVALQGMYYVYYLLFILFFFWFISGVLISGYLSKCF
jgi:hypothetical protein